MIYSESMNEYKLSSGKTFCANCGIIGINNDLNVTEGYDGDLLDRDNIGNSEYCDFDFTKEELKELADYMIELWKKFKEDL